MIHSHERYVQVMKEALSVAHQSALKGEVPIGAVIVHQDAIIACAGNEVESRRDATAHAECLAIQRASEKLGNWRLTECALFVTLEPCTMCIGAIQLARIPLLVFGSFDPKLGAVGSLYDLSLQNQNGYELRVVSKICQDESQEMLKNFFQKKRSEQS